MPKQHQISEADRRLIRAMLDERDKKRQEHRYWHDKAEAARQRAADAYQDAAALSYSAIAEKMGVPLGAVRSIAQYAHLGSAPDGEEQAR